MNTFNVKELNQRAQENPQELIRGCEEDFSQRIKDIARQIQQDKVKYVFISGPTSSGKTTFSKKFADYLKDSHHLDISLDDYYKPLEKMPLKKNGEYNFESIFSLNLDFMYESFRLLKEGKEVYLPLVDFMTQKRIENHEKVKRREESVVVIEGLHALNSKITGIFEGERILKVFIMPDPTIQEEDKTFSRFDFRFIRRMVRDFNFRNAEVERSLKMWLDVRSGEKVYMDQYRKNADVCMNTFLAYEPCILKRPALELLSQVPGESEFGRKVARLQNLMERFVEIPLSHLPEASLLNEFVKRD